MSYWGDVAVERERQRALGWTKEHDAHHDERDWTLLLAKQVGDLAIDVVNERGDWRAVRVQLGAVLQAWIESQP